MIELSIVVPLYNEEAVARELVARCVGAGEAAAGPAAFELLLVDDCSTDATPQRLAELTDDARVHALRPERNVGQFRAVQLGLSRARGRYVAVLDGDLQDPPETIVDLMRAMRAAEDADAVFAVKAHRDDPPFFLVAQAIFHGLQSTLSARPLPRGASSYCLMRHEVAAAIARVPFAHANLGALVSAMGLSALAVPYVKQSRRDGRSRLGSLGHLREALASMILTGALARLAGLTTLALMGAWLGLRALHPAHWLALTVLAAGVTAVALHRQHHAWRSRLPPVAPTPEQRSPSTQA